MRKKIIIDVPSEPYGEQNYHERKGAYKILLSSLASISDGDNYKPVSKETIPSEEMPSGVSESNDLSRTIWIVTIIMSIILIAYTVGLWSFEICVPAGEGMQFCF